MKQPLVIATRNSPLALWQAEEIKAFLTQHLGHKYEVSLLPMTSTGDMRLERRLADIGGKGLFTKELEEAMAENRAQLAVHSCKDVPLDSGEQWTYFYYNKRGPVADKLVFPAGKKINQLLKKQQQELASFAWGANDLQQQGGFGEVEVVFDPVASVPDILEEVCGHATIGTSSTRRIAQWSFHHQAMAEFKDLRGNLQTRLNKLNTSGDYAAIILAQAGLKRLNLKVETQTLNPDFTKLRCMVNPFEATNKPVMASYLPVLTSNWLSACFQQNGVYLPAPAQGILALQLLTANTELRQDLEALLGLSPVALQAKLERQLSYALGGSCTAPIAVTSKFLHNSLTSDEQGKFELVAAVQYLSPDGTGSFADIVRVRTDKVIIYSQELTQNLSPQGKRADILEDGLTEYAADMLNFYCEGMLDPVTVADALDDSTLLFKPHKQPAQDLGAMKVLPQLAETLERELPKIVTYFKHGIEPYLTVLGVKPAPETSGELGMLRQLANAGQEAEAEAEAGK